MHNQGIFQRYRIASGIGSVVAGLVVVLFNFQQPLESFTSRLDHSSTTYGILHGLARLPSLAIESIRTEPADALYLVIRGCVLALFLFIGIVFLLGLVHWNFQIPGLGLGGLLLGAASLSLVAWVGLLAWTIFGFLFTVLAWLFHLLAILRDWIAWLLVLLSPFILAVLLIAGAFFLWKWLGTRSWLLVALSLGILYLLSPWLKALMVWIWENVVLPVYRFLYAIIEPVLRFLLFVAGWILFVAGWILKLALVIVGGVMVIGILGSIGYFVIDQFSAAWKCGGTKTGILIGSFSLGGTIAVMLLVAQGSVIPSARVTPSPAPAPMAKTNPVKTKKQPVAKGKRQSNKVSPKESVATTPSLPKETLAQAIDRGWRTQTFFASEVSPTWWFAASLPGGIQQTVAQVFRSASAPVFDAVILGLATLLSALSAVRGLFGWNKFECNVRFYSIVRTW